MNQSPNKDAAEAFGALVRAFHHNVLQLWAARSGHLTLVIALLKFRSLKDEISGHPYEEVLRELQSIHYDEYSAVEYVSNISHLVHATALFDTFLSECTLFLFMLHPGSMGKSHGLQVGDLLAASSRNELIGKVARGKTREEAYGSFSDRLEKIKKRYRLKLELDPTTADQLAHYSSIRNTILHDQAAFDVEIDDQGIVCSRQKACPLHPTPVSDHDIKSAMRAYEEAGLLLACAIYHDVLKISPDQRLLSWLERKTSKSRVEGSEEPTLPGSRDQE